MVHFVSKSEKKVGTVNFKLFLEEVMRRMQLFHHAVNCKTPKAVLVGCAHSVPVPRTCGRDRSLDQIVGAVKD